MRGESIGRSCKRLVTEELGEEAGRGFSTLYGLRSKILHEGVVPVSSELHEKVRNLNAMVSDVLVHRLLDSSSRFPVRRYDF